MTSIALPAPPPQAARVHPFGAAKASAAFLMMIGMQSVAGVVVMLLGMVVWVARGADPVGREFVEGMTAQVMGPMLIAVGVVSTIVAWLVARLWAWDLVFDRSAAGVGLRKAPGQQIAMWSVVGAIAAASYLATMLWIVPFDPSTPVGPLAKAAAQGGGTRIAWAMLALLFAPLVEEFFFRGLLLTGFTASWGAVGGGAAVTVLFVLVHIAETYMYWPATAAIVVVSLCTLAARRMSGSLVPAMALHLAYNLVIVVAVFSRRLPL